MRRLSAHRRLGRVANLPCWSCTQRREATRLDGGGGGIGTTWIPTPDPILSMDAKRRAVLLLPIRTGNENRRVNVKEGNKGIHPPPNRNEKGEHPLLEILEGSMRWTRKRERTRGTWDEREALADEEWEEQEPIRQPVGDAVS